MLGAPPEHSLQLGHGVRVRRGECTGEAIDRRVHRGRIIEDPRVEPVTLAPFGVAPIGVAGHGGEGTVSDAPLDYGPADEWANSHGHFPQPCEGAPPLAALIGR